MINSCILWVIALLVIFYLTMIFKSVSLGILLFCGITELIVAIIYTRNIIKHLSVQISVPLMISECDKDSIFIVKTVNNNRFIVKKLKLKIKCVANYKNKSVKKIVLTDIVPGTSLNRCNVRLKHSGNFEFSLVKCTVYDLFGLFGRKMNIQTSDSIVILPNIYDIGIVTGQNIKNFFSDADFYDELRPGYDPNEVFDTREYRDGDRLQNIHWKLSAKNDELIVRENSLPKACPIVMFIERGSLENSLMLDAIASISYSLMDLKQPHYASWYSDKLKDIIRARIDDEESFYLFITSFLKDIGKPEENIKEMYEAKYKSDTYLYSLEFINGKIKMNDTLIEVKSLEEFELIFD